MSNAHVNAYEQLQAAAAALGGPGIPTLGDFKDARDLAKSAHETLDASYKLLSKGIRTVIDDVEEETKLFKSNGEPAPEAEIPAAPEEIPEEGAAPEADLTLPTLGFDPSQVQDAEIVELSEGVETDESVSELAVPVEGGEIEEADPLAEFVVLARKIVEDEGKITTKRIRADFSIGYEKARRVMDQLEAEGLIDAKGEVVR